MQAKSEKISIKKGRPFKYLFVLFAIGFVAIITALALWCMLEKKPAIHFLEGTQYNFGIVDEGKLVSHAFSFVNTGNSILEIEGIKTTCSCTVATPKKRILLPGEKSEIVMSYKAEDSPSEPSLNAVVKTNDPKRPYVRLEMQCKVHLKVYWFPKTVSINKESSAEEVVRQIRILTDRSEMFTISGVSVSSSKISASVNENGKEYLCLIKLNPHCPAGNWTEYVTINTILDSGLIKDIRIPVYLMVKDDSLTKL